MNKQCFSLFDSDLLKYMYIAEYFVLKKMSVCTWDMLQSAHPMQTTPWND